MLKALRRDFVFDRTCHACPAVLTSNIAVIMADDDGIERAYGPTCAANALGERIAGIPDYTKPMKAIPRLQAETSPRSRSPSKSNPISEALKRRTYASTYLTLRMDLLRHFPGVFFPDWFDINERFRAGEMSEADINRVISLDTKNLKNNPKYSLANLVTVYAFDRSIEAALRHVAPDKHGYLKSLRAALRKNLFLTSDQVQKLNRWFQFIPNQGILDANGFTWAWEDDYSDVPPASNSEPAR